LPPADGACRAGGHSVHGHLVGFHRVVFGQHPGSDLLAQLAPDATLRLYVDVRRPAQRALEPAPAAGALASRGLRSARRRTPRTVNWPSPATSALSSPGITCTASPAVTACS